MIFSVINTTRAKIYLFTTGTLYKIDSRTLVFAPSGQGFFYLNLPARSYSAITTPTSTRSSIRSRKHTRKFGSQHAQDIIIRKAKEQRRK
jgi:hypothetical protein